MDNHFQIKLLDYTIKRFLVDALKVKRSTYPQMVY